jgi:uncharacterized FlaG/YvyC family protein
MTLQIGRFTPYESPATGRPSQALAPSAHRPAAAPAGQAQRVDAIVGTIPPVPTAEARAEVDRAAERVDELRADGRELHFSTDPTSSRVIIEVRDLEGNVLKTIPPSKVLHVMAGGEL